MVLSLLFLSFNIVNAGPRIITNNSDNVITMIRNTKGNIWESDGYNLQLAIDDLDDKNSGSVYIGNNIEVSSTIIIDEDFISLDFQGNSVTLTSDVEFIRLTNGVDYCSVENVVVYLPESYSSDVFKLYIPGGSSDWSKKIRYCTFKNIVIINTGSGKNWTGLHQYIGGASIMLENSFINWKIIGGCENGLLFNCPTSSGWCNGALYKDIYVEDFETLVNFENVADSGRGWNQNVFENVKGVASERTKDGFKNINGAQNHFCGCGVFKWSAALNPNYDWSIQDAAFGTCIIAHEIFNMDDNSAFTTVLMGD